MGSVKLNLGCGRQVVEGWVNVDYALGARFAQIPLFSLLNKKLRFFRSNWDRRILIHDLRCRFPFEDSTVDVIYTSHTLEHFTREEGLRFLKECHRVLKPNGIIRVLVPDLETFVAKYINGGMPANEFVEHLGVLGCGTDGGLIRKSVTPWLSFPHKCMYDAKTLIKVMKDIGFQVEKREAFDSDVENIEKIEIESRTLQAVIVEGGRTI